MLEPVFLDYPLKLEIQVRVFSVITQLPTDEKIPGSNLDITKLFFLSDND